VIGIESSAGVGRGRWVCGVFMGGVEGRGLGEERWGVPAGGVLREFICRGGGCLALVA
jgi:hypothetical protein